MYISNIEYNITQTRDIVAPTLSPILSPRYYFLLFWVFFWLRFFSFPISYVLTFSPTLMALVCPFFNSVQFLLSSVKSTIFRMKLKNIPKK